MAMAEAHALVVSAGGSLACQPTTEPRMRECTGSMPFQNLSAPVRVLISSVDDSAAVIVLTGNPSERDSRHWLASLTDAFGIPNEDREPWVRGSWQWIRRSQMLRVILRGTGRRSETAVALTDGPLLDALGRPLIEKPD